MTFYLQRSHERGKFSYDWLETKHSFSFGNYYNPSRMGFGSLKVLNDDVIAPGKGFGKHPHQDMEIITLVLKGSLAHEDSRGNKGVLSSGDVQVMSAGKGILHSEYNNSSKESVELFQLWIDTANNGLVPSYDQKKMHWTSNYPRILVSGEKTPSSLFINQEATIIAGKLQEKEEYTYELHEGKGLFVMNVTGNIRVNEQHLDKRDTIEFYDIKKVIVKADKESLVLLIEVTL